MAFESESPLDSLWKEYGRAFQDWDDLTLARWLAQTLGELEGRAWRLSHPLVGAYRLGAQLAHDRQILLARFRQEESDQLLAHEPGQNTRCDSTGQRTDHPPSGRSSNRNVAPPGI